MKYLIVREHDDSLVREHHGDDDTAEAAVRDESARELSGDLLLFRDGRLMAWARDGQLHSFREEPLREGLERIAS